MKREDSAILIENNPELSAGRVTPESFYEIYERMVPLLLPTAKYLARRYFPQEDVQGCAEGLINDAFLSLNGAVLRGRHHDTSFERFLGLAKIKLRDVAVDALRRCKPTVSLSEFRMD
ncbi:hypothetical protein [Acanthopleuribacter pedis]|uniref:Uncharacterized protein n=1 Tax=Acanthopleuribacter pedis TaxID=442870 RepID=A0A8J7QDM6_9BACT|nr:hypothetical protein [Acanthopleuribacter pedis]MBO1321859.1 hypothetical protein [Acanthopleuribacter pedis]